MPVIRAVLRLSLSIAPILLTLMSVAPVRAQVGGLSSLSGRVLDASGSTVPEAKATLTNTDTQASLITNTDNQGRYTFLRITPGPYRLTVEKTGFRVVEQTGLRIEVSEAAKADVSLQVGSQTEQVSVTADTVQVQTQSSTNSLLVAGRNVRDLPLNGRDFARLIRLAPGIGNFNSAGGALPTPSISGARSVTNTYTIDGLGNSDERADFGAASGGGAAGFDFVAAPNVVSTEAIQEFRIITSNADATFGRGSGGQINIVTKNGTNEFHGSAYEYLRNDKLDARSFFNNGPFFDSRGRSIVPPFRQNLFGASTGGRIVRDKHFFFANYEGFRQRRQETGSFVAPNPDLIGQMPGDLQRYFSAFFNTRGVVTGTTTPGQFSPLTANVRSTAIAAGYPLRLFDGNPANGEAGTLLLSTAPRRDVNQDAFLIRTDHIFTDRFRASARFGRAAAQQTVAVGLPLDLREDQRNWNSAVAEFVYTLTPSQVLELRAGVLRPTFSQLPAGGVTPLFTDLGVRRDLGISVSAPGTGLSAAGLLGESAVVLDNQTVPQVQLQHSWKLGQLTLRSGLDLSFLKISVNNGAGRPSYNFNGFFGTAGSGQGLLGTTPGQATAIASAASASIFGANGGPTTALRGFTTSRQEYFTQADWRVRPNLTLNMGLRYSYFGVYSEVNGALSNLYAVDANGNSVSSVSPFTYGRTSNALASASGGRSLYQPDYNNFQPRAGFAWNVGGSNRTVVRGAYGLYNDRVYQLLLSAQGGLVNNPPFTVASSAANVPFQLGAALPVIAGTPLVTGINPEIRNPYTHRVTVGVEREVLPNTTLAATYVGTFARKLFGVSEVNGGSALPAALRPDRRFSVERLTDNTSSSNYNALQLYATRRFSAGLTATAAYTYAHSVDDSSAETFAIFPGFYNRLATTAPGYAEGADFVPRDRRADRGNSEFLLRHNFTASWLYELPFGQGRQFGSNVSSFANAILGGWSLSGILSARSGEPFSVFLGSDADKDGNLGDRAALLSGSLSDLHPSGLDKTQYLSPRTSALSVVGASTRPNDPYSVTRRNSLFGPSLVNLDLSILKTFRLSERINLRFEGNAFNILNRAQFGLPVNTISDSRFGRITDTAFGTTPRQFQIGAKLLF